MQVDGKLGLSLYEIISILGLPKKGENYRDVRKAILRMAKLQIDPLQLSLFQEGAPMRKRTLQPLARAL